MKKIFVAATQQHDGKTTLCLGLYQAARKRGLPTCFIKPVGQRYVVEDGEQVDEDAVLFKHALMADGKIKDLNPVTVPRGLTREYIFDRDPERIRARIREVGAQYHDLLGRRVFRAGERRGEVIALRLVNFLAHDGA